MPIPFDVLLLCIGSLTFFFMAPRLSCYLGLSNNSGRTTRAAHALLTNSDYKWVDSMKAWGGEIHVDPRGEGHLLLISRHSAPRVVGFGDLRQWGYDPLMSNTNHHLGWRFKVTTNDAPEPITFIDIRGTNRSLPETWLAKLNAYING